MAQIGSSNVSMDTIKSTLQGGGGSVSNDLLTFFTTGAKINPWSKWKPIIYPADFVDNEASFKAYDWGIAIPTVNSIEKAFEGSSVWTHKLPTGGSNAPYRLGDFRNYRPDATSPFRELYVSHTKAVAGDEIEATLYCRMFNDSNESGMLGLTDLGTLSGCKVIFIKKGPTGYETATSDYISANHGSASAKFKKIPNGSSYLGNHVIMAALTKGDGIYYPLPISSKTVVVEVITVYTAATIGNVTIDSSILSGSAFFTWGTTESASSKSVSCVFELVNENDYLQQSFDATLKTQTVSRGERKAFYLNISRSSLYSSVISLAEQGKLKCRASFNNGNYVTSYTYVTLF